MNNKEVLHRLNFHVAKIDKLNWDNDELSRELQKYSADAFFKFQLFQHAVQELTEKYQNSAGGTK